MFDCICKQMNNISYASLPFDQQVFELMPEHFTVKSPKKISIGP